MARFMLWNNALRDNQRQPETVHWRMGWDSNPRWACTHAGFQDRCLKPLGHPSILGIQASSRQPHALKPKIRTGLAPRVTDSPLVRSGRLFPSPPLLPQLPPYRTC
jgi:hypothetical protein